MKRFLVLLSVAVLLVAIVSLVDVQAAPPGGDAIVQMLIDLFTRLKDIIPVPFVATILDFIIGILQSILGG